MDLIAVHICDGNCGVKNPAVAVCVPDIPDIRDIHKIQTDGISIVC